MIKIDGDVYTNQADVFALLVDGFNHIVADVIATLIQLHKNCSIDVCFVLADVIARMADVIANLEVLGRCYSPVADVIATVCLINRLMLLPCG